MIVSAIVAAAKNRVIGKNNDIPWYLPADLKYFKKMTLNHHIIMGRKCYQSIGRPLPKRTNIVLTRQPFFTSSGCIVARSIQEALEIAHDNGEKEAFIIGGGEIYQQSMEFWDKIYYTDVDLEVDGEVYFPEIPSSDWKLVREDIRLANGKNEYNYNFKLFERK